MLPYRHTSALLKYKRNFYLQQMEINVETHNHTTGRKQEAGALSLEWNVYITYFTSRFRDLCKRVSGKMTSRKHCYPDSTR